MFSTLFDGFKVGVQIWFRLGSVGYDGKGWGLGNIL